MAQKITFTFNIISGIGTQNFNLKFNANGANYFNEDIIITEFIGPTGSNVVNVGPTLTDFAANFKNTLINILPPIGNVTPFYYKMTQNSNVVEIITGVNTNVDLFLLNDVVINGIGNPFSTFATIDRVDHATSSISLSWSGASDDNGIVGYEVQFRIGSSPFWQTPIYVSTPLTGGVLDIPIIDSRRDYTFRIRTKDNAGQYSDYKIVSPANSYLRSSTSSVTNACLIPTSVPIYLSLPIESIGLSTITAYSDTVLTVFNGGGQYWAISSTNGSIYSVLISTLGDVTISNSCGVVSNFSYRSRNKVSLSTTMCSVLCIDVIFYSQDIIGVGIIFYNNLELTIPFTYTSTTNDYYLVDDVYVCQINRLTGEVMQLRFRSQYCTPTTTSGGSGGCCLLSGSEILLSNGDVKNIEDIVIGDEVITYDIDNKCNIFGQVTELFTPLHNDIIKVILSNDTTLDCTSTHPLWCVNKNSWVSLNPTGTLKSMSIDIQELSINDILLNIDGYEVYVIDIYEINSDYITTYDISVTPNNNYYANDILVHNKIAPVDNIPEP